MHGLYLVQNSDIRVMRQRKCTLALFMKHVDHKRAKHLFDTLKRVIMILQKKPNVQSANNNEINPAYAVSAKKCNTNFITEQKQSKLQQPGGN